MCKDTSRAVGPSSDLEAALASVTPGDGLELAGGDYFLHRPLIVDDRFLQGNGTDVARIHGTVVLSGTLSQVWGIGVHAPKDGPAFDVVSGFPTLIHCAARLRPDAEEAAIRVNDAGLEIDDCVVEETEDRPALVARKARLSIERSRVGHITVGESKVSVSQSTLGAVRVNSGAIVALGGACTLVPAGKGPGLVVDSGGTFTAPQLYYKGDNPYIHIDNATVDIPRIQTDGARVRISVEGDAHINLDPEMCVVVGSGANEGEVL